MSRGGRLRPNSVVGESRRQVLLYSTQLLATGGIESHIKDFCAEMTQAGYTVDLLCPRFEFSPNDEKQVRASCNNVRVLRSGNQLVRQCWLIAQLIFIRFHEPPAIVYTNGQGRTVSLVGRILGAAGWVHHHHMSGDESSQVTWPGPYRRAMSRATALVACSETNAAELSVALDRTANSVPCFSKACPTVRSVPAAGEIRLGYFGRLIPEKGIDLLGRLSSDPQLSDIRFVVWGEGADYGHSYFKRYPNLDYRGRFEGRDGLRLALESMDGFLLLTSHQEGLPIALLESMSSGLPWLATGRGGVKDIANVDAGAWVIASDSSYQLVATKVREFADKIGGGDFDSDLLVAIYEERFSSSRVAALWDGTFQLVRADHSFR